MATTKQRTCRVCGADCRRKKVGAGQGAQVICMACHAQGWRFLWGANQVVQWMRCTTCRSPVRADESIKGEHGQHYCSQPCQDWRADDATQLAEAIAERDAAIARADAAIMRAEAAEAALERLNTPCTWQDISGCGIYRTTCGKKIDKVTPCCPQCGRRVVKKSAVADLIKDPKDKATVAGETIAIDGHASIIIQGKQQSQRTAST